ncbi:MAG: acyltransferase family protein [Myxococcota bacterium]
MTDDAPFPRHGRRYDLDWLRVGAFGLLILYHAGMFYVTWDWHVKSPHAGPTLEVLMLVLNPWRLALLFFISGVGARFAADKLPAGTFARRRLVRLGVPLLFGMLVIVPPQSYLELREAGIIPPGFFRFYPQYLSLEQSFEIITPTWNHLWYVVYLLAYSLLLVPLHAVLQPRASALAALMERLFARGPWVVVAPALPFIIYRFALDPYFPTTHAFVGDWANHAHRFTIFLFGYLIAKDPSFWTAIDRNRRGAAHLALGLGVVLSLMRVVPGVERWVIDHALALTVVRILYRLYAWWCIAALVGWAQRRLNHPGPWLTYLNEGVYPFYIVHQTIIVVTGYTLARLGVPLALEVAGILLATSLGCLLAYELARRVAFLGPLLGLRTASAPSRP